MLPGKGEARAAGWLAGWRRIKNTRQRQSLWVTDGERDGKMKKDRENEDSLAINERCLLLIAAAIRLASPREFPPPPNRPPPLSIPVFPSDSTASFFFLSSHLPVALPSRGNT